METISVIILTYNNHNYLYEAVDSVLIQDYPSIELIISDDGSQHFNTAEIENYIRVNNKGNIKSFVIRQNPENYGTVKNLNNALKYATGEYIMPFAGDDVLIQPTVLSFFFQEFKNLSENEFIVTTKVNNYDLSLTKCLGSSMHEKKVELLSAKFDILYAHLALDCFIPSGGTVYRKLLFSKFGLFDESYRLVEDWPFLLKMTRLGVRFNYGNFEAVKHRSGGVSGNPLKNDISKQYQTDLIRVIEKEILPNLSFLPSDMRYKIKVQCMDKLLIYKLRYEYPTKSISEKISWLFTTRQLIPAVIRAVIRKGLKHGG